MKVLYRLLPCLLAMSPYFAVAGGHALAASGSGEGRPVPGVIPLAGSGGCSNEAFLHAGQTAQGSLSAETTDPNDPAEGETLSITVTFLGQTLASIAGFGQSQTFSFTASADGYIVACTTGTSLDNDEGAFVNVSVNPVPAGDTEGDCNASEPGAAASQTSCGDPINTYTGNFTHTFTDLSIPGRGFPWPSLTRTTRLTTRSMGRLATAGPLVPACR